MPTPPKSYRKKLPEAKSKEERVAMVRRAMEDGHSNKSAAVALGLKEEQFGVIAGIRRTYKIPSLHKPTHGKAIKVPKGKAAALKPPAPPPPASDEPDFKPFIPPTADMALKLAGSDWTHQCIAKVDGGQCGYRQIDGEKYCPKHIHLKNE